MFLEAVIEKKASRLKTGLDYFPFGGQLPGRIWQQSGGDYRYGYQGQEKSMDDSNWDNFELRNFNHDLGRWSAPDPYAQFHSPYLAMANNPISKIDPNGGYILSSDQGLAQRAQFMQDLDRDRMAGAGRFNFNRVNTLYREALTQLVDKYLKSPTYMNDAEYNDEGFLKALLAMNNDFAGLGYPNMLMSVGIDFVSMESRNTAIFKELTEFNGSAAKAEEMAAISNSLKYSVDRLHMAEQNWMGENDARQRAYVNNWRNGKWEKQAEAAARKKAMQEAKEREKVLHSQTDILAAALQGNLMFPGFAGGASVAGSFTNTPSGKGGAGVNLGGYAGIGSVGGTFNIGLIESSTERGFYINYGGNLNLFSAGGGISGFAVIPTENKDFELSDFSGFGGNTNAGFGLLGVSYGGGANAQGKTIFNTYGVGIGGGVNIFKNNATLSKGSLNGSWGNTFIFKIPKEVILWEPGPKY